MPRIPNHQYDEDWDDPENLDIQHDEPTNIRGDKISPKAQRKDRDWEETRREYWRKRSRDDY